MDKYLRINIEQLEKSGIKETLIVICKSLQEHIKEHYDELINIQRMKREKEDESR